MIEKKEKNLLILFAIFVLLIIFALSITKYSEYKEKNAKNKSINLKFNTKVAKDLSWHFSSKQSYLNSKIGQVYRIEFNVENEGKKRSSGKAVYEISPNFFKQYFVEMDCFCYKKQTLLPGEKSKYSVTFYIDDGILKNSKVKDIIDVNILYTFLKADDL
tara:strand:- start:224 stop:703 length:480 start_codon:yes stop_codon:yes gene_type:complete